MPINIEMPKLSDTMTEGHLVKWMKKVGDEIEVGDIIAEVETDKATMEMEAFDEGTLVEILVDEGTSVPVGSVLGVILEEGETSSPTLAASVPSAPVVAPAPAPQADPAPAPVASTSPASSVRINASPLARKMARAAGIELSSVTGTGIGGRIVKADIEAFQEGGSPAVAETSPPVVSPSQAISEPVLPTPAAPVSASAPTPIQPVVAAEDTTVALSSMRRIIADRLLTSKTTIPHFYLHVEADTAPLMTLRKQVNVQSEQTHGNKYSINDFVIKAVICAVQAVPEVNASYDGDQIVQFAKVGVSVAIAVDDGLVTPVIKDAAGKSMLHISKEVKEMAVRARENKLHPSEFDGGTLTISNLGAWGVESFDAIVNPPQAVILSVGAIVEKPVVVDGEIVPGLRMNIGVSCDHRVVDGAVAAKFINEVKKFIENPVLMLM
jgi:pyruvate dehydrogenase E2 component (dihydrolipoamide acetyltransferase)